MNDNTSRMPSRRLKQPSSAHNTDATLTEIVAAVTNPSAMTPGVAELTRKLPWRPDPQSLSWLLSWSMRDLLGRHKVRMTSVASARPGAPIRPHQMSSFIQQISLNTLPTVKINFPATGRHRQILEQPSAKIATGSELAALKRAKSISRQNHAALDRALSPELITVNTA